MGNNQTLTVTVMIQYLSTYTIVSLYHIAQESKCFLTTKSLIKSKTFLAPDSEIKNFENTLFYIEIDGNNMEFNVPIEYDQPIYLKHKISQKYLTLTEDQQDENEVKYRLSLGTQKKCFKIKPCYQYQKKISTKIKFNEEIYLSTEYVKSREMMIMVEEHWRQKKLYLNFIFGSKLQFHYYSTLEVEQNYSVHDKIVWISHIQSSNFLTVSPVNGKEQVVFQPIEIQKQIQNMSALWIIQSDIITRSSHIQFEEQIHLRNLLTGSYLTFSENYQLQENQKIFQIFLDQHRGNNSKFLFRPIQEKDFREISKKSYVSLLHCSSNLYLGCRKEKVSQKSFKLMISPQNDGEDFYKLHYFTNDEEQALRLIVALRADFEDIEKINKIPQRELTLGAVVEIQETYLNIKREFQNLKKYQKLYEFVRNQLEPSIRIIASNLAFFRSISDAASSSSKSSKSEKMRALSGRLLSLAYHILCIFCQQHSHNQAISFEYIGNYLTDVGDRVGAEEVIAETFKNNKNLLPKATAAVSKDGNAVRVLLIEFHKKNPQKNEKYWQNLQKIIQVFNSLIFHNGAPLDINQNLISQELFKNGFYERTFLPIRVQGPRVIILDPDTNANVPIQNVKNPQINSMVDLLLLLFSNLTENHSFNSKNCIHSYLAENNQACLSVLISYLNKPIRRELYNKLLNFVSKTYLDSCPRLKRIKPLSFIFFHFQQEKSHAEQEEGYISQRLKEIIMLRMEESQICKPLHYSNLLPADNTSGAQPSMNQQQLVSFRLNLTQRILNNKDVSENQLQTIHLLMELECYTTNEMLQIYEELKRKLLVKNTSQRLLQKILAIIDQIYLLLQELETKKMTIYLKRKFTENQQEDLGESEYKFILPLSSRVPVGVQLNRSQEAVPQQELLESSRSEGSENLVSDYNELRDTLALMHAKPDLKKALVAYFCDFEEGKMKGGETAAYLESLFNIILKTHLPKYHFLLLVSKSTVLTHEEVGQFDHLFSTSKKLQYLILISDYWMVNDNDRDSGAQFLRYISELTSFLFEDYDPKTSEAFQRKLEDISTKRQLFVNSLGVHQMVLELLEKNSYLVTGVEAKKDVPRQQKEIFEACFEFVYFFIRQCTENKRAIEDFFPIVLLYQSCVQLGQLRVYTEFFRDEKGFIKELDFGFVENTINRIVRSKGDGRADLCEYDPDYLELIIVMVNSLDSESTPFVDKLYNYIAKPEIFSRLFYPEEKKEGKETTLCLKMHKIKLEPLQLPLLYHHSLLSLCLLILSKATESIKNSFKLRLTQMLKVSYLFEVLALPDKYSNTGIEPILNSMVKEKVLQLIGIFLERPELTGQIYESDSLTDLLQFWIKVFIKKSPRTEITSESQSFYLPFLEKVTDKAITNDKTQYYHVFIKPFLEKLVSLFQKQKIHGKVRQRSPRNFLFPLYDGLRDQLKEDYRHKQTTFIQSTGLKDVKLKWRNFVDDDEDNSKEEKYVKKVILEILKSKKSSDYITEELHAFYSVIQENCKPFIRSMVTLLKILFNSKEIAEGRMKESKTALKVLKYLSQYIEYRGQSSDGDGEVREISATLQECNFIQVFTDLTGKKEFELRKMHLKTTFYYCLKIVNFLLHHDQELKFSKLLYRIFRNNAQAYQFLDFIKQGALQIISTIDPVSPLEQVNTALAEMSLCTDAPPVHLHEQAFRILTYLCRHEPFTQYLRNQQSSFADTDFLDKLYNILLFLFKRNDHATIGHFVTISSVRAAEHILDFVSSMLTGPNRSNQNYLMDNKYAQFVLKVLKLDDLPERQYEFSSERSELLEKIVEFYRSNGIEIEELLESRVRLFDFRHSYLLNRFKAVLVKALLECLVSNETNLVRVKMDVPLEVVKLNLIWVYEAFKKGKYEYTQEIVLRDRVDWDSLIEKDAQIDALFLRLGFYYYQLIDLYEDREGGESPSNDEKIINEEKEKERVVKKFFSSIMERSREAEKLQSLEQEQMREQMKYYFHTYYNALLFFRKKTGTIEVDLKGDVIKVYFPKLPIAERITEQMEQDFKNGVKRVSRDEKIKSMIEYENEFYEDLKGEEDYFNEIESRMPVLGPVLRMMKYEDEFLLAGLLISFLITVLYLLADYETPTTDFPSMFFQYIGLGTFPKLLMLLLSVLNLLIGLVIGVYLFTRKIPLRKKLLSLKFAELQLKEKDKEDTPTNETAYVLSNIFQETAYNIYIVVFLLLTIVHPFFSAFPLIETINRIEMGRFIIKSIKETWSQLLVAVGLLIVFNVVFVQIFYEFYTAATGYGTMCKNQQTCFKLLMDQNLKGGAGVLGNVDSDYTYMALNTQVLAQIIYIMMSLKVIAEIFSGTIIDKFSELRQQQQKIEQDENKICFICGQQRFDLDLQYEGFSTHTEQNHYAFNYIKYLFYLRRCQPKEYGIVERYINEQRLKQIEKWIPQGNSISKQIKTKEEEEEKKGEKDLKDKIMGFVRDKVRDMKRVRQKVETMKGDLKRENKKIVEVGQ